MDANTNGQSARRRGPWGRRVVAGLAAGIVFTALAAAQEAPHPRFTVWPRTVPHDDAHATVITLDATGSEGSAPDATLRYAWSVPGARFVDGTDATSPVARITVPGGWLHAVELAVSEGAATAKGYASVNAGSIGVGLDGRPVAWQPLELWIPGPQANEGDTAPNPFLDHRLVVTFRGPRGQVYDVPGFFAGDGTGGGSGNVWKVRFAADEGGRWTFRVGFRSGPGVAVELARDAGSPGPLDEARGNLVVLDRDPDAEGFFKWGRLEYVGKHYLKFREGPFFIKGGTDSPENLLGYKGFDDVQDNGNLGILHEYAAHADDWRPGDPYFVNEATGVDSMGLVGALNYLSSVHVNSVYFLPMNLGGDAQDTCPFLGYDDDPFDKRHYDVSRLHQWARVFDHAQARGILLHVVLAETEWANEHWLDDGGLGVERKLFFREMVARFGAALALKWNLSEENDFSVADLRAFADYLAAMDPYDHPIGVHTHPNDFDDYQALVGDPRFTSTSIQYDPNLAGSHVESWRSQSTVAGRPWILDMDENNPYWEGLMDDNADELRKQVLYDVYFSGGQVEWYAGYHSLPLGGDVTLEDFRTREPMWNYMWYARRFMQENLRFWEMQPADHLVTAESSAHGGAEVFAHAGQTYAIYFPSALETGVLDLSNAPWAFVGRWYDPRTGEFAGEPFPLAGGAPVALPAPPSPGGGTVPVFQESDGLVVMEVESAPAASSWRAETAHPGYTGDSYYRWDGPDYFWTPGNAILAYDFDVHGAGTYELRIHNRHDHPEHGEENDVWVSVDGSTWTKAYSGNYSSGYWNFFLTLHLPDDTHVQPRFDLDAGRHQLRLSARSHNFKIDRIHLYRDDVANPLDTGHPESSTVPGSGAGDPEDWVLLVRKDD